MTAGGSEQGGPTLLNLSEVRKINGAGVETLRLLVSDDLLPGVVRSRSGHVKLRADMVPSFTEVSTLLHGQLGELLRRAREQVGRVEVEVEAVRNDVDLAVQDPMAPLGHDLLTLRSYSHDPTASSLTSALSRLELTTGEVRLYQAALRDLVDPTPTQLA